MAISLLCVYESAGALEGILVSQQVSFVCLGLAAPGLV